MKSDILLTLIKEVVRNEVKQQVKEEITRLIKSGKISLNKIDNQSTHRLTEGKLKTNVKVNTKIVSTEPPPAPKPKKEITKNPILNEILNQTEPFTAQQRAEGGPAIGATGGSILDALQPSVSMEGDWETMDYRGAGMPQQPMPVQETDNAAVDALTKALTRDYRELVKRFK